MSLIAAEMERRGIATVCLQLLREVAEKVRPPRALCLPFPHGFPLGEPLNATLQMQVIEAAFALLQETNASPPLLREFKPS